MANENLTEHEIDRREEAVLMRAVESKFPRLMCSKVALESNRLLKVRVSGSRDELVGAGFCSAPMIDTLPRSGGRAYGPRMRFGRSPQIAWPEWSFVNRLVEGYSVATSYKADDPEIDKTLERLGLPADFVPAVPRLRRLREDEPSAQTRHLRLVVDNTR